MMKWALTHLDIADGCLLPPKEELGHSRDPGCSILVLQPHLSLIPATQVLITVPISTRHESAVCVPSLSS